jgi:hypothetical protein
MSEQNGSVKTNEVLQRMKELLTNIFQAYVDLDAETEVSVDVKLMGEKHIMCLVSAPPDQRGICNGFDGKNVKNAAAVAAMLARKYDLRVHVEVVR